MTAGGPRYVDYLGVAFGRETYGCWRAFLSMDFKETWPHARPSVNAAIESGDDSLFERLMEENCPVDVADNRGWRPLHVAAFKGHLSIVQRILQHEDIGIDWRSFEGETALWLATNNGHLQVCKRLLEKGAQPNISNNENESPLHMAVRKQHMDCARLLMEFGANVNAVDFDGHTPILDAAKLGYSDMVTLLIETGANLDVADDYGIVPLFAAAESRNLQCVRLIHEKLCSGGNTNVDVEANDGTTPLMIAAQKGWLDCVHYLLDKGADVDHAAKDGVLAIHLATQSGHLGCVKDLLPRTSQYALLKSCYGGQVTTDPGWLPDFLYGVRCNGALDLPEDGISILHLAVEWEWLEILKHLLESGIHPDHYIRMVEPGIEPGFDDIYGYEVFAETALGLACCKGSVEMVTALVDNGAQFTLGNYFVCNPLHRALIEGCPMDFIRFLVKRGAELNSHTKDDNDVPPVMCYAFKNPHRLHDLLALGGRIKNWDNEILGSVAHMLMEMANTLFIGSGLLEVLSVLVHFMPRHQFRPLYSIVKEMCQANPSMSLVQWTDLDQVQASPESLLQLCRLKTREAMMMRKGFRLESDVLTLQLPQSLQEYLMFR